MKDHYAVLGISPAASSELIRSAYRRQANQFHPDKNAAPEAPARFREIQAAYETLSDAGKRQAYDEFRQRSLVDDPAATALEIWSAHCSGATS